MLYKKIIDPKMYTWGTPRLKFFEFRLTITEFDIYLSAFYIKWQIRQKLPVKPNPFLIVD